MKYIKKIIFNSNAFNLVATDDNVHENNLIFTNKNNLSYIIKQTTQKIGETITSGGNSEGLVIKLTDIDGSTNYNKSLSELLIETYKNGNNRAALIARKNIDSQDKQQEIQIQYDQASDAFVTYAPHPPSKSNNNEIATTKWVRDLLIKNGYTLNS